MATCKGNLSNGDSCMKTVKRGQKYCRWHDPDDQTWRQVYASLEKASPRVKTNIVLKLIEDHPEGRLELPRRYGKKASLKGIDLSAETLEKRMEKLGIKKSPWYSLFRTNLEQANLEGADLTSANLRGVDLSNANLQNAILRGTKLESANLAYANIQNADLTGAFLASMDFANNGIRRAALRKTNLKSVNMTVAHIAWITFEECVLENAELRRVILDNCEFLKSNLRGICINTLDSNLVDFEASDMYGADLSGSSFSNSKFRFTNLQNSNLAIDFLNCDFYMAKLQGAKFIGESLHAVSLQGADLRGVDLTTLNDFQDVRLDEAWLGSTRINKEQIGNSITEEKLRDYLGAERVYRALKQNFESLGDYGAASWAYCKEKDMQMFEAWKKKDYAKSFRNLVFKWLCKYGEGVGHVAFWIITFLLIIAPSFFHLLSKEFLWSHEQAHEYQKLGYWAGRWFIYERDILYTLDTLTTATFSGLKPNTSLAMFASGLVAILGVFLFGLFGFVVGNRIRRS